MHEVSLMEDLVAMITAEARTQGFARVRVLRIRLGALGPAEANALRFCFDAVAGGTIAEGASLDIEMVPAEGWCPACRRTVLIEERFAICPVCGSGPLRLVAGDDLRLAELEVE